MSYNYDDLAGLSKRVKAKRKGLGLTQKELSEELDYDSSYISQIETGKRIPSVTLLIALANVLNVSVDYILFGSQRSAYDNLDIITSKLSPTGRDVLANMIQHLILHESLELQK